MKIPFKISSLTLPFLGMSVEIIEKESLELKREVLKELYSMRRVLSSFCTTYSTDYELTRMSSDYDEDITSKLGIEYFDDTLNIYEEIEKEIIVSNYFILLTRDNKKKVLELFDNVRDIASRMKVDENEELNGKEVHALIEDLFRLYDTIEEKIDEICDYLD